MLTKNKETALIIECEKRLLTAIKNKDLKALDELLHENLLFNLPNGQTITKAIDMETHRTGSLIVDSIVPGEHVINLIDGVAVVTVIIGINGTYLGEIMEGKFSYIRVWKLFKGSWKVIAGSCTQLK